MPSKYKNSLSVDFLLTSIRSQIQCFSLQSTCMTMPCGPFLKNAEDMLMKGTVTINTFC